MIDISNSQPTFDIIDISNSQSQSNVIPNSSDTDDPQSNINHLKIVTISDGDTTRIMKNSSDETSKKSKSPNSKTESKTITPQDDFNNDLQKENDTSNGTVDSFNEDTLNNNNEQTNILNENISLNTNLPSSTTLATSSARSSKESNNSEDSSHNEPIEIHNRFNAKLVRAKWFVQQNKIKLNIDNKYFEVTDEKDYVHIVRVHIVFYGN